MHYSIVMPVFNREDLTQKCLATLRPTLAGAGDGEVIVVDNGSRPATASVLASFPWVRVIRNETNRGFAAACNIGARVALGRVICHLNNDIIAQPGWLAHMLARLTPDVGIVGAQLLFPDETIQHAGVAMYPIRFGCEGIGPYHLFWRARPQSVPQTGQPDDFAIVTGACLVTPRELFLALGGFDEIFWNGYEDVDYCLRVRERGLRVVYEPQAKLYHYESQSGVQRKRRLTHNMKTLGRRWGHRIAPDHNRYWPRTGGVRRETFELGQPTMHLRPLPPVIVIVHGSAPRDAQAFVQQIRHNRSPLAAIAWFADGNVPTGCEPAPPQAAWPDSLRTLLDARGDRYIAFVDTATRVAPGWLDALANAVEYGREVIAATVRDDDGVLDLAPCASDARCTVLNVRELPRHVRFGSTDTMSGAIVDLTWQALHYGLSVRAIALSDITLAPAQADAAFCARYACAPDTLRRPDVARMEAACAERERTHVLVSIIIQSWNVPELTRRAVEAVREHTTLPYELLIVDNGSSVSTRDALETICDARVIYNALNRGFACGANTGIGAARGTHVVLLDNDVLVTAGWLEGLLAAMQRDPRVGLSGPRTNTWQGYQSLEKVTYASPDEMTTFAAGHRQKNLGLHRLRDRAGGFCLCIDRTVFEEIGAFDEGYGNGTFADDDFCLRARAAGYGIAICDDVFVHHFGRASFTTNGADYDALDAAGRRRFVQRWDIPVDAGAHDYDASLVILRGFIHTRDYVAFPGSPSAPPGAPLQPALPKTVRRYETAFVALVDGEAAWSRVGPIVTNYVRSLSVADSTLFAIGVTGAMHAATIAARITRSIERMDLNGAAIADIDVADVISTDIDDWIAAIPAASRLCVIKDDRFGELEVVVDRSPSGLARAIRTKTAVAGR